MRELEGEVAKGEPRVEGRVAGHAEGRVDGVDEQAEGAYRTCPGSVVEEAAPRAGSGWRCGWRCGASVELDHAGGAAEQEAARKEWLQYYLQKGEFDQVRVTCRQSPPSPSPTPFCLRPRDECQSCLYPVKMPACNTFQYR